MDTTKITGLTALNTRALAEILGDSARVTIGKTVATFNASPEDAFALVNEAAARAKEIHGGKGHPVQSLHAVVRKLHAQTLRQD